MHRDYESLNSTEQLHLHDSFTLKRYLQMSKFAPSITKTILDVGCGSGRGGDVLKNLYPNASIVGIDAVLERTFNAPSSYESIVHSNSKVLPFEDQQFDFVVAGEVLEHIDVHDVDYFLCEISRVLNIGGVFVMTTPNPNDIKLRMRKGTVYGRSHISQHFPSATKQRLNFAGLRVKRIQGTGKVSNYLGKSLPLSIYGSYMIVSTKS
jgi:ubiquinone/menaquinone biosynthesis C-methylase UbiE